MPSMPCTALVQHPLANAVAAASDSPEAMELTRLSKRLSKLRKDREIWHDSAQSFEASQAAIMEGFLTQRDRAHVDLLLAAERQLIRVNAHQRTALMLALIESAMRLVQDAESRAQLVLIHDRHSPSSFMMKKRLHWLAEASRLGIDREKLKDMELDDIIAFIRRHIREKIFRSDDTFSGGGCDSFSQENFAAKVVCEPEISPVEQRLRRLYRRLVQHLHPDREQDPDLHRQKTELVQAANRAYRAKDIMALMEIQASLGAVMDAETMSKDLLVDVINTVRKQISQLEDELRCLREDIKDAISLMCDPPKRLTIKSLDRSLEEIRIACESQINHLKSDVEAMRYLSPSEIIFWVEDHLDATADF